MERPVGSGPEAASESRRSISGVSVLFGLAAFVYLVFALVVYRRATNAVDASAASAFGRALSPLVVALVVRGVYVGLRWRWSRVRFVSGWLLVLAAVFAFFGAQSPSS